MIVSPDQPVVRRTSIQARVTIGISIIIITSVPCTLHAESNSDYGMSFCINLPVETIEAS